MSSHRRLIQLLPMLTLAAAPLRGADWADYHGPNGDGSSPEAIRTNWTARAPQVLWRKPIGPGWSSMAVAGGKIFTQVRRSSQGAEREYCVALDEATGNEIWARDVDSAVYTDLAGYSDQIDGPRSTPSVEGDRVYVLTSYLHLYCLNAANGNVLWHRDFMAELGSGIIPWENTASPLLAGDLILLNVNAGNQRLMAVRKSDGGQAWRNHNDSLTHATPILARISDVPQAIFLTGSGLVAVVPETGSILWRLAFTPSFTSTAASPSVSGSYVHSSAAYGAGTWLAQVMKNGASFNATQARRQQGVLYQLHWATPVAHDGFFYCIPSASASQSRLTCFDPASGTNRWSQTKVGTASINYGSVIKAANALIVLTEGGELVLVQPDPNAYKEIDKFKVLNHYCWNRVALSNGRIYARNSALASEIVAVDVAATLAPLPAFELAAELTPDRARVQLTIRALAGGVFSAEHLNRLEIQTAPRVPLNPVDWVPAAVAFSLASGAITGEFPRGTDQALYFRAREKTP